MDTIFTLHGGTGVKVKGSQCWFILSVAWTSEENQHFWQDHILIYTLVQVRYMDPGLFQESLIGLSRRSMSAGQDTCQMIADIQERPHL